MAETLAHLACLRALDVSVMATGQTDFLGARSGKKFLPISIYFRVKTYGSADEFSIAPIFKVGSNASTWNNILTSKTIGIGASSLDYFEAVAPSASINVASLATAMKVNITTAGVGPSSCTVDFFMTGIYLDS